MLTTTRSWEYGMRLAGILNEVNGVNVSSHSYTYDNLNRRTRALLEDGSRWDYTYNDRNELTGAPRSWPDWTPVAGQQFGYAYDNIGNRKTAQSGGDTNGANLRPTGYTVNSLNQYTTITNLGYADILGAALATNAVWVNGALAERKGEYFRRELQVGNASGPVWTNVTVASGGVTNTGGLIVPDDRQALVYDLDGNLTFDGTWSYTWDGENRLRTMTMTTNVAGIAASNILKLEFTYDYQGRRVQKVVKRLDGSGFGNPVTTRFVYDGWNLIAILASDSSLLTSFTWGQDLSGTMEDAGGIGGLLLMQPYSGGSLLTSSFFGYDGNGNVAVLVDADALFAVARYEYSPFGETLRATGPLAKINPFRFSTKFADDESGLVYYGYRYYSPMLGRFVNRDPIEEEGGNNLFGFVVNNAVGGVDPLGQAEDLTMLYDLVDNLENLGDGFVLQAMNSHIAVPVREVNDFVLADMRGGTRSGLEQFGALTRASAGGMNLGTLGYLACGVAMNQHLFSGGPMGKALARLGRYSNLMIGMQAKYSLAETGTGHSERFWAAAARGSVEFPGRTGWQEHHVIPKRANGGKETFVTAPLPTSYHYLITRRTNGPAGDYTQDVLLRALISAYSDLPLM